MKTSQQRTKFRRTRVNTTLILLDNLSELGLISTHWLSSIQTLGSDLLFRVARSVWVESEKNLLVEQRILLLNTGTLSSGLALGSANDRLDFGGVDETADISLLHDVGRKEEVLLQGRRNGGASVDRIQSLESSRSPDDEATEVSTRGELQEVQGEDSAGLDTGDVAESLGQLLTINLGIVDYEGSTALTMTASTQLSFTSAKLAGSLDLLNVGNSTNRFEETDGSGSARDGSAGKDLGVDYQGDLWNVGDLVPAGEQESWNRGCSKGGNGCEAPGDIKILKFRGWAEEVLLLTQVDLLVPLSPDLGRSEHTARSAHVTKCSLSSTVGSSSRNTGNTGNSAT